MKERNDNMIYIWRIIFANMIVFFTLTMCTILVKRWEY